MTDFSFSLKRVRKGAKHFAVGYGNSAVVEIRLPAHRKLFRDYGWSFYQLACSLVNTEFHEFLHAFCYRNRKHVTEDWINRVAGYVTGIADDFVPVSRNVLFNKDYVETLEKYFVGAWR